VHPLNSYLVLMLTGNVETQAAQLEAVARTRYMGNDEDRDPVACSLFYFALRKRRLMQTLWKQASGHPERNNMIKFLQNNFDEPRWRTAALKNAYVLLSKHRFGRLTTTALGSTHLSTLFSLWTYTEFAAAFFLLGDSLNDAVSVCLKQLDDFQLAIAICRVYEGDDGPVLARVLKDHVIPLTFRKGWRRLASWAFWMLKRRDLAVRVLVVRSLFFSP
jgi:hypothetical protein